MTQLFPKFSENYGAENCPKIYDMDVPKFSDNLEGSVSYDPRSEIFRKFRAAGRTRTR